MRGKSVHGFVGEDSGFRFRQHDTNLQSSNFTSASLDAIRRQ